MIEVTVIKLEDNNREVYYITLYEEDKLTPTTARLAIEAAGLDRGVVYGGGRTYRVVPGRVTKLGQTAK